MGRLTAPLNSNVRGHPLKPALLRVKLLFEHRFAAFVALLGLSLLGAIVLLHSSSFWQFMSWLPRGFSSAIAGVLIFVLTPIQPEEVHEQEEQLEFFLAWGFSATVILVAYFVLRVCKRHSHACRPNAL